MTTKEEFVEACMKDGTSREDCEKQWESSQTATSDADKDRKIAMLEARVETREKQLRQAYDIAIRANAKEKAQKEVEKITLIDSISIDGKFTKDELQPKTLEELQIMRTTLDKSIEKTFASVAADNAEQARRNKPRLTVGAWDSQKKEWIGGI